MDRVIKKKRWTTKFIMTIAGSGLILTFVIYNLLFADTRSKLNIDIEKISISSVKFGDFQEFIPVNGTVQPIQTVYLDAIEGGVIQKISRHSGAMLKKGDTILTLTNSNLQLEVMNREAQLYEQINNLRNSRLLLEQNSLNLKAQLAEINYQLKLLKPQYDRQKAFFEQNLISKQDFEAIEEQYLYNVNRKKITFTSYKQDSLIKVTQLKQLNDSEARMWNSLGAVSKILNNLIVKAPIEGQLAAPELEVGQSISPSTRLGQIDILDSFKVRVKIDELYLPRINEGQEGSFDFMGKNYRLRVTKIYPTIAEGRFDVDMHFTGDAADGIKRGQTLRIKLELGNPGQATLLAVGGFYQQTGGNWVYVLNEAGDKAYKRNIRLGRKNTENYEVLEGLKQGERVITSGYDNFGDNEVLVLK
jgi:HlyD family secretion protein